VHFGVGLSFFASGKMDFSLGAHCFVATAKKSVFVSGKPDETGVQISGTLAPCKFICA
jgi:hypothetical protein